MLGKVTQSPAPPRSDDAPVDCRRLSPRLNQHDREAVLLRGGTKAKIRVLNLSQTGFMAECRTPPSIGERIDIALDSADPVPATTLWVQRRRFGAEFALALPFEALWQPVAVRGAPQAVQSSTDRIVIDAAAVVRLDGFATQGRIRNVSVRGMLIETVARLEPEQMVEIDIEGWPAIRAAVMWSRDGRAGVHLERPLTEEQILGLKVSRRAPSG